MISLVIRFYATHSLSSDLCVCVCVCVCVKDMNYSFAVKYCGSYRSCEQFIHVKLSYFEPRGQFRCMRVYSFRIDIENFLKF